MVSNRLLKAVAMMEAEIATAEERFLYHQEETNRFDKIYQNLHSHLAAIESDRIKTLSFIADKLTD